MPGRHVVYDGEVVPVDSEAIPPRVPALLPRIAAGDAGAVREFLERYSGLVWALARRMCPSDAEDAVQDIFVNLWKNAARFDESVASESTFVAMIARRRLIDLARRRQRRPDLGSPAALDDLSHEAAGAGGADTGLSPEASEEARRAREALDTLQPEQQRVLRLTVLHGLTHEETAAATGLPLGTVKTHARRGLMRIRELLESTHRKTPLGAVT